MLWYVFLVGIEPVTKTMNSSLPENLQVFNEDQANLYLLVLQHLEFLFNIWYYGPVILPLPFLFKLNGGFHPNAVKDIKYSLLT